MPIELTYTATHKARALSSTLGALPEAEARNWLIRALAAAKPRHDLAAMADMATIYELPADHLTSYGGRLAAVVRTGDQRSDQMVAVTIKALSTLLRAMATKEATSEAQKIRLHWWVEP